MTKEAYRVITFAATLSTLIPLITLFIYRKGQPRQNLILAFSLALSFVFDVIGFSIILFFNPKSTSISNNLYFILALPAIMWFYHETLTKKILKIIVRILTIGFLIVAFVLALKQGLNVNHYTTFTLSSILVTVTSLFFVVDLNLMDDAKFSTNKFHESNIILNTSLALYYFITIVIFAVSDYFFSTMSQKDSYLFWAFHNMIHMAKNVGIAVAFYLSIKKNNRSSEQFNQRSL